MKKIFAVILTLAIAVSAFSVNAFAVDTGTDTETGFGPIIKDDGAKTTTTTTTIATTTETTTKSSVETSTETTTATETTTKRSSSSSSGSGSSSSSKTTTTTQATTEETTEATTENITSDTTTEATTTTTNVSFNDTEGHWAENYIEYVVEKGLFSGVGDNNFAPDVQLTRGMAITVIGRACGVDTTNYSSNFKDVDSEKYYAPYIAWANENGIARGIGDGMFAPDKAITRQEMAVFVYNASSVLIGADAEVISEYQAFSDDLDIASWAKTAVYHVRTIGLITGRENNIFAPNDTATRAEFATIIYKLLNK